MLKHHTTPEFHGHTDKDKTHEAGVLNPKPETRNRYLSLTFSKISLPCDGQDLAGRFDVITAGASVSMVVYYMNTYFMLCVCVYIHILLIHTHTQYIYT